MAVAAQRVLGRKRLAGALLEPLDELLLAFQRPVRDAEQQAFEQFGADRVQQFGGTERRAIADQRNLALAKLELVELFQNQLAIRHRRGQQQQEIGLGRTDLVDKRGRVRERRGEDLVYDCLETRPLDAATLAQL